MSVFMMRNENVGCNLLAKAITPYLHSSPLSSLLHPLAVMSEVTYTGQHESAKVGKRIRAYGV